MICCKTNFTAAVFLSLFALAATANADIVFNIIPGPGDTTSIEIIGTGQVENDGLSGLFLSGDFLTLDPSIDFGITDADLSDNGITLGGRNATFILFQSLDLSGEATFFEFGFDGGVSIGSDLSELNGTYLISDLDFNFDAFNPGQYDFGNDGGIDAGTITVNVAAVPEQKQLVSPRFAGHLSMLYSTSTINQSLGRHPGQPRPQRVHEKKLAVSTRVPVPCLVHDKRRYDALRKGVTD